MIDSIYIPHTTGLSAKCEAESLPIPRLHFSITPPRRLPNPRRLREAHQHLRICLPLGRGRRAHLLNCTLPLCSADVPLVLARLRERLVGRVDEHDLDLLLDQAEQRIDAMVTLVAPSSATTERHRGRKGRR